mmetsp:Transcript_61051/g.145461  ORF Transcript_61051/g.145461 Transcript_61051/m.145461 type:complete len:179 (-) Transcript_61051:150-686(-)
MGASCCCEGDGDDVFHHGSHIVDVSVAHKLASEESEPEGAEAVAREHTSYKAPGKLHKDQRPSTTDKTSLTPQDRAEFLSSPEVFEAEIPNEGGKPLGCSLEHTPGERYLRVVGVTVVGMIPSWNEDNRDKRIDAGFHILAVNDKKIEPDEHDDVMTAIVLKAILQPSLRLIVRRIRP